MIAIARKFLSAEKTRFGVAVFGVGCVMLLVLVLLGVFRGIGHDANEYVHSRDIDIWVARKGSSNLMRTLSYFDRFLADSIETVSGVSTIDCMLRTVARIRHGNDDVTGYVFGIDPRDNVSAPDIIAGTAMIDSSEIILDEAFARNYHLSLGDTVLIREKSYRVAALSEGTNALLLQFAFVNTSDAEDLLRIYGITSFCLVSLDSGLDRERIAAEIEQRFPLLSAYPKDQFTKTNLAEILFGISQLVWPITTLGLIIGWLILSLILYGSVMERREDYLVMMALGAERRFLSQVIARQSFMLVSCGYIAGLVLLFLTRILLYHLVPLLPLRTLASDLISVAVISGVTGLFACWLPIHRLYALYPADVFSK